MNKNTVIGILISLTVGLTILLFIFINNNQNKEQTILEKDNLIEASNAKLEVFKNKNGVLGKKIKILETQKVKDFTTIQFKDSTITALQQTVKDYAKKIKKGGSVTKAEIETKIDTTTVTKIEYKNDSCNPTYRGSVKSKWFNISSISNRDSTSYNIFTKHDISLIIDTEGNGVFRKKKNYAYMTDSNPHSNIKNLKTYKVSIRPKKFVIGAYLGYGILNVGDRFYRGYNMSIGIGYKFIEF